MTAPLLVLAGFAIVAALIAWARWLAGRRWAAAGNALLAVLAAFVAGVGAPAARDLDTYEAAPRDHPIAAIRFEQVGARRFRATLTRLPSGRMQVFELPGDQWRLAVRQLEWTPRAAALGLAPRYRIDALAARDSAAPAGETAGFALARSPGTDLWARATPGSAWSAVMVPRALGTPWLRMAGDQRYELRLERGALVVEPRGGTGRPVAADDG